MTTTQVKEFITKLTPEQKETVLLQSLCDLVYNADISDAAELQHYLGNDGASAVKNLDKEEDESEE